MVSVTLQVYTVPQLHIYNTLPNARLCAFIVYSLLISDEDYCDKPVGANTTGVIKIYTIMDLGVLIFTCV